MTWYVASVIMSIKRVHGAQNGIPVYENFVLIEGNSPDEALQKAILLGKQEEQCNDDMTLDNEPAKMVFEGIRKIVNISNPEHLSLDQECPVNGTELTYSEYLLDDEIQLKCLVTGKEVSIRYLS